MISKPWENGSSRYCVSSGEETRWVTNTAQDSSQIGGEAVEDVRRP